MIRSEEMRELSIKACQEQIDKILEKIKIETLKGETKLWLNHKLKPGTISALEGMGFTVNITGRSFSTGHVIFW